MFIQKLPYPANQLILEQYEKKIVNNTIIADTLGVRINFVQEWLI